MKTINNIKKLREAAGLTQDYIAKELGVGQSTVAMWETGNSMPRGLLLPGLAKTLKCKIDDLFVNVSAKAKRPTGTDN